MVGASGRGVVVADGSALCNHEDGKDWSMASTFCLGFCLREDCGRRCEVKCNDDIAWVHFHIVADYVSFE